jgi:hypothetical protein
MGNTMVDARIRSKFMLKDMWCECVDWIYLAKNICTSVTGNF